MGVGGNFWDLLKPYAQTEGFDFLRDKRVAVDLSFWIVQHETAIKAHARNPHLRLTFFRTINLFAKFGAFPIFVVDGTPSLLKSRARIERFCRAFGIDLSDWPVVQENVPVERNSKFLRSVQECVELLELLGMPVLRASGEAEALCAQLNSKGQVDACITADSDAFLYGANCVIKHFRPNSKEPFECYHMSDIEAGLGLKRKHLIAMSLLVGNDHDLKGVPGIGIDTALRFAKSFSEDEILNRLHEIARGDQVQFQSGTSSVGENLYNLEENSSMSKSSHCSICGHPGSKRSHIKFSCEYCGSDQGKGCLQKPVGFKCGCSSCDLERKEKEHMKNENWQSKVCKLIASEQNFPNDEIIEIYLSNNNRNLSDDGHHILWESPKTDLLNDFLAYYQHWEPSYVRRIMLPMLSTIFLREMASSPKNDLLLHGQYEFDSIQREKVRFGHEFFVVNWKKAVPAMSSCIYTIPSEGSNTQSASGDQDEPIELSNDEPDVPQIRKDGGCWFLLTDENKDLVQAAFPEKVAQFLHEKELKGNKSSKRKSTLASERTPENSEPPKSSVQLSITEFYRASKKARQAKSGEDLAADHSESTSDSSKGRRQVQSPNISKSARRRLLFD